jgi:hypothetical protein
MFASKGETTAPCGVPTFVSDHWPSSDTPALSHFWIKRTIRRSATRCWRNFSVHSWLTLSKETTTHYPSSALLETSDHHWSPSPIRRTVSGGPPTSTHARRLAVRSHSAGRKQVADTRRIGAFTILLSHRRIRRRSARWVTSSVSAILPMLSCAGRRLAGKIWGKPGGPCHN